MTNRQLLIEKLDAAAKSGVALDLLQEAAVSRGLTWNGFDALEYRHRQVIRSRPMTGLLIDGRPPRGAAAEARALIDRIDTKIRAYTSKVGSRPATNQQIIDDWALTIAEARDKLEELREPPARFTPAEPERTGKRYPFGVRRAWMAGRVITIPCHAHQEKYLAGWSAE